MRSQWNLLLGVTLLAACGGDVDPERPRSSLPVSTSGAGASIAGPAGQGAVAGRLPPAGTIAPPAPQFAGMSAPPVTPPPPPPAGAPAPPVAGRPPVGGMPPAGMAGRGAGGMSGPAAGMTAPPAGGMSAAGSGGTCTMNLACKLAAMPSSGDIKQDCVDRINQFRTQCACMTPLERWTAGESCADMMAASDGMTGTAHGGFMNRVCTPTGNGQNECPGYPNETYVIGTCLQQMWDEGPPPMTPCNGQCFQMYGHFLNMTNKSMKKVACGFAKNSSGKIWAVQNFSP